MQNGRSPEAAAIAAAVRAYEVEREAERRANDRNR
jgi:hypothetical protein